MCCEDAHAWEIKAACSEGFSVGSREHTHTLGRINLNSLGVHREHIIGLVPIRGNPQSPHTKSAPIRVFMPNPHPEHVFVKTKVYLIFNCFGRRGNEGREGSALAEDIS